MRKLCLLIVFCICTVLAIAQPDVVKPLTVGVKITPPFIIKDGTGYHGLSIDLWEHIAKEQGLSFQYKEYGFVRLLEATEKGEVDICINPFTVTSERLARMDFTQPFYISNLAIAVSGGQSSAMTKFILNLFSWDFLQVILLLFVVILFFGFIIWRIEREPNDQFGGGIKGLGHGIWWSAVTMTTVGYGDKTPTTMWGRLVGIVWMFTAVIIISSFTGNIAATLTVDKIVSDIENVDDLVKKKVGTIQGSSSERFLKQRNIRAKSYGSVEEAVAGLALGSINAFVYDEPIIKYAIKSNGWEDRIQVLPNKFNSEYYSFSMPHDHPQYSTINTQLIKTLENIELRNKLANKYRLY